MWNFKLKFYKIIVHIISYLKKYIIFFMVILIGYDI